MSERSAALLPNEGTDFAAALAAPPVNNLRRIGGEMFAWSDRDPQRGPALPRGAVLRHLIGEHAAPGRTVLVAGPHAEEVVVALADSGAAVTWLLRSLVDAEEAARNHPRITVLAGAAVKLDAAEKFDLVVAADGVERLNSAEGEQMTAAQLIDRLAEAVQPDGVLLLVHDNRLGVHHTVRLEPGARERHDSEWYAAEDEQDTQRPASQEQLAARLAESGLTVGASYAVFPEPAAPTVLVGEGLLGEVSSPLRPRLGTALSQAFAAAFRGRPVLSDPRRLVNRALRAGAESTVAPAWLIIAQAQDAPAVNRHELLIGDARGTFAYEVASSGNQVRTTVLQPLEGPIEREGLRRISEPTAPGADAGYVLEERLLHLAATNDLRNLRIELTQYDAWLRGQAQDGLLTGPVALAGLADVFVTEDGAALLPTRWEPVEPVPFETVETRAIWQFAVQLITSGQAHPWPVTSSAVDLTAIMLGMVGQGVGADQVRAAVDLHVRLETADLELSLADQHDRRLQLLAVSPGSASVDVAGFRELTEALWRQRYQASHLLSMMDWTEQMIKSRDLAVSKMDWEVQFYKKTWAGRFLWVSRSAYRVLMRDGRKFVRGRRARKAAEAQANAVR
ncbi:class I SAM-dependent methyltransferase [Actinoplanes sp. URMC 104]|uniref:class I SAM-dependent methyltransferase n=1 Tax=Actinoplanes sp. URMC 104 TaxID=3423409 RepID=UPI003F1E08FD